MDKVPPLVAALPRQDRSCSKCDWSWTLIPTPQELKLDSEVRLYCCSPGALVKRFDGVYPRSISIVRGTKALCGIQGKWWQLAREEPEIVQRSSLSSSEYRQKRKVEKQTRHARYEGSGRRPYDVKR